MLKSHVHVLLISRKPRFVLCFECDKNHRGKIYSEKKSTKRKTRSIRVLLPRWAVVIREWQSIFRIPSNFPRESTRYSALSPGSSWEWQGIPTVGAKITCRFSHRRTIVQWCNRSYKTAIERHSVKRTTGIVRPYRFISVRAKRASSVLFVFN